MLKNLQNWVSRRTPWFYENSILPVVLSKLAPIEVNAFSFGPFVFARGELTATSRQHETIHYHQQIEMLFVFQWLLYASFSVYGFFKKSSGKEAYYNNPFEREAYDNEKNVMYLDERPMWNWTKYIGG